MGALYLGYAYMIFNWIVKLVAIYGMFLSENPSLYLQTLLHII